jgi:hypothetical protein
MPNLAEPPAPSDPVAHLGIVVEPPAALGDPFTVRIPAFDDLHVFEIRRWEYRGPTLPAPGDECLVIVHDKAEPWVAAWWPAAGDSSTDIFLDARDWVGRTPTTSDRGPQLQKALEAARDEGPGAKLILPPWQIVTAQPLEVGDLVNLDGHGPLVSDLKLGDGSNCDILTVENYESGGVHNIGLRNFSIEGNSANNSAGSGILSDGVSVIGDNLIVHNCAEDGIVHTQSRPGDESRAFGEDDSFWHNVKVLDSGRYGIRSNAHDCHYTEIWVCSNDTCNFVVDEKGYASKLTRVHAFGGADYGIEFRASAKCVNCEGEGGRKANVLFKADNVQWIGGSVFYDGGSGAGKVGFEWATGAGFNTLIDGARVNDCVEGAFKFTGTGSNSRIRAVVSQKEGKVVVGEPGSNIDFDLHVIGEAKPNLPIKTVASSGTISLPNSAKVIEITGKNEIKEIEVTKQNHEVTLRFRENCTVKDGNNLDLKGDFNAKPDDTLELVCGVTEWHEKNRSGREGGTMYGPAPLIGTPASAASPGGSKYESVRITIPNRATLTGVALRVGNESKNSVRVYLHDLAGNLLANSSVTAMGTAEQWQRIAFQSKPTIEAGDYVLTIQYASVTSKIYKARMLAPTLTAEGPAEFGVIGKLAAVPTEPENVDRPILVTY